MNGTVVERPARSLLMGATVGLLGAVGLLLLGSLTSCQFYAVEDGGGPAVGPGDAPAVAGRGAPGGRGVPGGLDSLGTEPNIRVRIAGGVDGARLGSIPKGALPAGPPSAVPGPVWVALADPSPSGQWGTQAVRLSGPISVTLSADSWVVVDAGGSARNFDRSGELQVSASEPESLRAEAPTALVVFGDSAHPGAIRLDARSEGAGGGFDVIEHLPLEVYLNGVVAKEMYINWPPEAYKVQAVCARTYALHERQRAFIARRAYDVESTARDQAYGGAARNKPAADAVAATRGVILAYERTILRAYYSSTCGGRTGAARDTWPIYAGYEYNLALPIQEHRREFLCQDAPLFRWEVERGRDELIKRFRAFGQANGQLIKKIEGLAAVEVLERNSDDRPSEYKVVEPGGKWYRIKAEDLRLACNYPASGAPEVNGKTRVNSGDVEMTVPTRGPVVIKGRGYGHGVGMCQYCARNMALRGDDWKRMLGVFYPGAQVVHAYR